MKNLRVNAFFQRFSPFLKAMLCGTIAKTALTLAIWGLLTAGYLPRPALQKTATQIIVASNHMVTAIKKVV